MSPVRLGMFLVAVAASGCGQPARVAAAPASPTDVPAGGEQLLAQPPAGWVQISGANTSALRAAQFVPEGDDPGSWSRMIKFEAMKEDPLPDPIDFVTFITEGQDSQCGTFESYPTFAGLENGYETAVNLLICHQDRKTKRSDVTMMKTIRGNDHFYVITRSRRGPPVTEQAAAIEEEVVAAWSIYMKSISVCDPGREGHPCPTR